MAHEDMSWSDAKGAPQRNRRGWLGWLLFVLFAGASAAFVYYLYLPLRAQRVALQAELARAGERERGLAERIKQGEAREKEGDARFTKLEADCDKVAGELRQTVAEKEQVEAELKRVQVELSHTLEPEIHSGNVRIRRRGQELVLDLANEILFDTGKAEVSDGGRKLLSDVAKSLAGLPTYAIQVAGHTDSARVVTAATQERFPTNWELSTGRATNVVRFLQERGKIPGARLTAAGFAEYRPTASNASEDGRAKNRRIEILLVPPASRREDGGKVR